MIETISVHRGTCEDGCHGGCYSLYTPKSVESPVKCRCEVCEMGIPTPMDEWLKNPVHKQIHERIKAALASGEIHVQGETK